MLLTHTDTDSTHEPKELVNVLKTFLFMFNEKKHTHTQNGEELRIQKRQ